MKEKIEPCYSTNIIHREYSNVPVLLRKLFNIPDNEMCKDCYWDKDRGRLILILKTIRSDE